MAGLGSICLWRPQVWLWAKHGEQQKRHIVLHYHIFKNAGTTIYSVLQRNFGYRLKALDSGDFNGRLNNDVLLEFLREHPRVRAISSHHLVPPKPKDESLVFHDILFLRHPLARLSSMYAFYRRTGVTDDPLTREAKKRQTGDFMRLLLDCYPHYVNNPQVEYLAAWSRTARENSLQTAFRIAAQATVLGVAEMFDMAAVLAEEALSPFFKHINFGYVAQNVSSAEPRQLDGHLAEFRDACGDQIYEQLLEANRLDIELLELARRESCRRFEQIPNHEERLRQFLAWRGILHPSAVRGVLASNHPHNFADFANAGTS